MQGATGIALHELEHAKNFDVKTLQMRQHRVPLYADARNSSTEANVSHIDLLLLYVYMRHFCMQNNNLNKSEAHAGHVVKARLAVYFAVQ